MKRFYFRTAIVSAVLILTGLLSSCGGNPKPPVEKPEDPRSAFYGTWIDRGAVLNTCGNLEQVDVVLDFFTEEYNDLKVAIQSSTFDVAYGEGLWFTDTPNPKRVTGTIMSPRQSAWAFDFDLELENSILKGEIVSFRNDLCENGEQDAATIRVNLTPSDRALEIPPVVEDMFEPNDSSDEASTIELESAITATLTSNDWFKFTLPKEGVFTLTFDEDNARFFEVRVTLMDDQLEPINEFASNDGWRNRRNSYKFLPAGTYFLEVDGEISSSTHAYTLEVSASPLPDAEFEPNDIIEMAASIIPNAGKRNMYLTETDEDWLTFKLDTAQLVTFNLSSDSPRDSAFYHRLRAEGVLNSVYNHTEGGSFTHALDMGTYHLNISNLEYEKPYSIELTTQPITDQAYEPNDTVDEAHTISLPFSDTIHLPQNDEDWFAIDLEEDQNVTFSLEGGAVLDSYLRISRHNSMGGRLSDHEFTSGEYRTFLPKGRHFFRLSDQADKGRAYLLRIEGKAVAQ